MPLYYNTSAPSNGSNNSITNTATDLGLRDFLLTKNIQNPIKYPQLSTSINGSPKGGQPFLDTMVGLGVVLPQVSIEIDGLFRYDIAILPNHYRNTDPTAPQLIDIIDVTTTPIFPTSPSGTLDYSQEDHTQYGILAKSDYKEYRKKATIKNLYLDASKQIDMADLVSLQPIQASAQQPSYDEAYGQLTINGKNVTRTADIIGSVLNGQGVGIGAGGTVVPNFDIRSSLAGRVLGATGLLNDTKLGIIGGQQLALALANNAAFNVEQAILGKLNLQQNVLAIFGSGSAEFPRPNYKITVGDDLGGQILGTAERILGFMMPKSLLDKGGSIFFTESGPISNIERANAMLDNTGKGQRKALAEQFKANLNGTSDYDSPKTSNFRSGYSPSYQKRGDNFIVSGEKPKIYAFDSAPNNGFVKPFLKGKDVINDMNFNREGLVDVSGFKSFDTLGKTFAVNNGRAFATKFSWTSDSTASTITNAVVTSSTFIGPTNSNIIEGDRKSLLVKTQMLFNSLGMKNIIATKGDNQQTNPTQIQSSISKNGFLSKGSAVMSGDKFNTDGTFNFGKGDTPENTFCRVWTPYNRYDKVKNLIRHRGLNRTNLDGQIVKEGNKDGGWRQNIGGSVLDDNGFVKIAPYVNDDLTRQATQPKKYMFSIENLAWVGTPALNLLPVEQGPGDLLTGKFGRIMWFPPYDLTFSESSSVNLESTSFIGRGEPIYTYNNTERTGSLSFKIIIDHPSIMNAFKGDNGPPDEFIDSFFAGCVDLDASWSDKLTPPEKEEIKVITPVPEPTPVKVEVPKPFSFNIYFLNDVIVIDENYENDGKGICPDPNKDCGNGIGLYDGSDCCLQKGHVKKVNQEDFTDFGLNKQDITVDNKTFSSWTDAGFKAALKTYMDANNGNGKNCQAEITGYASKQGNPASNEKLATSRCKEITNWMVNNIGIDKNKCKALIGDSKEITSGKYDKVNTRTDSKEPKSERYAKVTIKFDADQVKPAPKPKAKPQSITNKTLTDRVKKRFYNEANFFEKLTDADPLVFDKIRQKIRYFHPAFHSTTPEGFNSRLTFLLQCTRQGPTIANLEAKNLAFGPPPVCILRIGDFYNTKIMIDNLSFDFEPLVWDLNPEGIGVQPMIANVSISFKFIGASSLYGPINKLQNALSFNYFANSQVYDPRADYIASVKDVPNKKLKETRKTFIPGLPDSENNTREENYGLVTGLDMTAEPFSRKAGEAADNTGVSTNDNQDETATTATDGQVEQKTESSRIALTALNYNGTPPLNEFQFILNAPEPPTYNYDYLINFSIEDSSGTTWQTTTMYKDDNGNWSTTSINQVPTHTTPSTDGNYIYKVLGTDLSTSTQPFTGLTSGGTYTINIDVSRDTKGNGAGEGVANFTRTITLTSETPTETTNITAPKITGLIIKDPPARVVGQSPEVARIRVQLIQEGIWDENKKQLITNDELVAFIKKGIAIVVEQTPKPNSDSRWEELISPDLPVMKEVNDPNFGIGTECVQNCSYNFETACKIGIYLGEDVTGESVHTIKHLLDGNYTVTVFYGGYRVGTAMFTLPQKAPGAYTFPYQKKGSYTATGTIRGVAICDELHSFQGTRRCIEPKVYEADGKCKKESIDIGEMNTKLQTVLYDMYDKGYNPIVKNVIVTVTGGLVEWEAQIEKSTDGKAWVGFSSRGSATDLATAKTNYATLEGAVKAAFPTNAATLELKPVDTVGATDGFIYRNTKIGTKDCEFWQCFAVYTLPTSKPAH